MTESRREQRSLLRDLANMRVGTILIVVGCLAVGEYIRQGLFGNDDNAASKDQYQGWEVKSQNDNWSKRQAENSNLIKTLVGGEERTAVVALLGNPDYVERYGDDTEVLYYRTQLKRADGVTRRDETTPLVLVDSTLASWGEPISGFTEYKSQARAGDDWESRQEKNRSEIEKLESGTNKSSVIAILGRPDFVDRITEDFEVLSYRTHSISMNGSTDRDEVTRLVFFKGQLTSKQS